MPDGQLACSQWTQFEFTRYDRALTLIRSTDPTTVFIPISFASSQASYLMIVNILV